MTGKTQQQNAQGIRALPGTEMPASVSNRPAMWSDTNGQIVFNARFGVRPPQRSKRAMKYGNAYAHIDGLRMDHIEPVTEEGPNGPMVVRRYVSTSVFLPCDNLFLADRLHQAVKGWAAKEHANNNTDWRLDALRDDEHVGVWARKVSIFAEEGEE